MSHASESSEPQRADVALVARGLAASRTAARRLIEAGRVTCDSRPITRPSQPITGSQDLAVAPATTGEYVSRAAHKLTGALDALAAGPLGVPRLRGRRVLDAGASTGGFTQVALERGAARVIAVDVGHDQLAPLLREDPRVDSLEGINVRDLDPQLVAPPAQVLLADLSFISLTLVLPALTRAMAPGADAIVLIKPQFEVGRGGLGKGGVVDDDVARARVAGRVLAVARKLGWHVQAVLPSAVAGEHGNRELLAWLTLTEAVPADGAQVPIPADGAQAPIPADLAELARVAASGRPAFAPRSTGSGDARPRRDVLG